MKLPNFHLTVNIADRNKQVKTKREDEDMVVCIYQPKDGALHVGVRIVCIPQSDGWYETTVYINEKEEVRYASNEKHEITHTYTSEGFRRDY